MHLALLHSSTCQWRLMQSNALQGFFANQTVEKASHFSFNQYLYVHTYKHVNTDISLCTDCFNRLGLQYNRKFVCHFVVLFFTLFDHRSLVS